MPAPLVVAALVSAGSQLLMNRNQPAGQFQPASFNRVPAPTFQAPPTQRPGGDINSLVMEAFLRSQMGTGASPFATPRGPTGLGDFNPMRQPPPIQSRF